MTDNKLTDEQIIKALERCGNIVDSSCKECAFHKTYNASCVVKLMKNTLDLINRQKAEIEQLERANIQLMAILQTAQSEARKEFAERLKEASYIPNMSLTGEYVVDVSDIDNLLKEMDGEQNE